MNAAPSIDLNADMGEGMGNDAALMAFISSASIACGGHAGDAETARAAIRAALARGVAIGAHPGFADRETFGRARLGLPWPQLASDLQRQLAFLSTIADTERARIRYVKLHGALANMAAEDDELAERIFALVRAHDADLAVLALENSAQHRAAHALGMRVVAEAYADRAYTAEGLLVSRAAQGAVIHTARDVVERCVRLARTGEIVAVDGTVIASSARSICIHGDTANALILAGKVRAALDRHILVKSSFDA